MITLPSMCHLMANWVKSTLDYGMKMHTALWLQIQTKIFLPIILAMDKYTISSSASTSVYPIMFTITFYDCKTHNKAHAWRPLGYIPIEKKLSIQGTMEKDG